MRLFALALMLITSITFSQIRQFSLSGKIVAKSTKSPLANCNISVAENGRGTVTDSSGYFILYLSSGKHHVKFSHIGFKTKQLEFDLSSKESKNDLYIEMEQASIEEKEVTVYGERQKSTLERQKLDQQDIKNMPNLYSDALRGIQILPGVTSNNELSSSYNVRGGNFDENLMYLNGFQIYRPFLLKQGVEENQTLINPSMLKDIQFYAGGFPARLGDKMSSALEIAYRNKFQDTLHGSFRTDLLNLGISINQRYNDLNYSLSFRYAYPGLFLNKLHTTGSYSPFFADIQGLINYALTQDSELELMFIYSDNRFQFSPYEFDGNFQQFIDNHDGTFERLTRGIKIKFNGNNDYRFNTGFGGLLYTKKFSEIFKILARLSIYKTNENENGRTSSDLYYSEDAYMYEHQIFDYLKSRIQQTDNSLGMTSADFQLNGTLILKNHHVDFGISANSTNFTNVIHENSYEISASYLTDFPYKRDINSFLKFISYTLFCQDNILIGDDVKLNIGTRYLKYTYTNENLVSPRAALYYYPSNTHTLNFSWGYYYQPPMYFELRNKSNPEDISLKSQKSIFFLLGWDYLFKEKVKFQIQYYYKKLDNLIPYYVDQLKLEYGDNNDLEGYAYGIDLQFQGEITKDIQSWIGYSYLNTKERDKSVGSSYIRRFLDQSHTVQIFLQDKFPKHHNWQSHLRIIFGSGFLFPVRKASTDSLTGKQYITTLLDQRSQFPFYMRADMGLTVNFTVFNRYTCRVEVEVLNVFNKQNIANYIWMQTFKEYSQPVWIPQMYSERFFNIGFELNF